MTKRKNILFLTGVTILAVAGFFTWRVFQKPKVSVVIPGPTKVDNENVFFAPPYHYNPGPLSMTTMKTKGCVADGLLSGYGDDTDAEVDMINSSECMYLHRALETWGSPPDFAKALEVMQKIKKPGVIYGMFLAEDIKTNAKYFNPEKDEYFDFKAMCRNGSINAWGEHTCKPSLDRREYRDYLIYVTERAMDIGIQSFLFGQIYYQDDPQLNQSKIDQVLDAMRAYAKKKGIQIAIGAQTGTITDEKYLKKFDYIEGGVGIGDNGTIEDGPCWSGLQSCWALLWNDRYSSKAKNVFLHLDWSGLKFDDMSSFARMSHAKRAATLKKLYDYFTAKNMGFLMPMMATLNVHNGGCHGPKNRFYSASRDYTCNDEGTINTILKKGK